MCQYDNVPICQLAALCFHRIIGTLTHCPIGTLFKAFFHWHIGTLPNWRHYKIFCVNVKYGLQYGFRIFYLIALQNEENYEREESCSA